VSDSQLWERVQYSPHRSHYALEPDEEHRRGKVDCLVRPVTITFGRLTGAQERQVRVFQIKVHEVRHRQHAAVTEIERAVEWLPRVLESMTRDVHQGCGWERCRRCLWRGHRPGRGRILDAFSVRDSGNFGHFSLHIRKSGQSWGDGVLGSH
jgi:hypothetical protein